MWYFVFEDCGNRVPDNVEIEWIMKATNSNGS